MISSGAPQAFVPFGREHFALHPGNPQPTSANYIHNTASLNTDGGDGILDAIREFSLADSALKESDSKEEWKLRHTRCAGDVSYDEELYFSGNTVIWSKGAYPYNEVLMSFTTDQPIEQAIWCSFHLFPEPPVMHFSDPSQDGERLPAVCILNFTKLNAYLTNGQEFTVPLPFQVAGLWPMKYGLLFERKCIASPSSDPASRSFDSLPIFFSLLHPLDEIVPVVQSASAGAGRVGYVNSLTQRVVFTSEEPSLVVTYDTQLGTHTVWKLRRATMEEGFVAVNRLESQFSHTSSLHQTFGSPVSAATFSGHSRFHSQPQSVSHSASTPFRSMSSRANSPVVRSRLQSPALSSLTHMATISRSQSPVASTNSPFSYPATPSPMSRSLAGLPRTPVSANGSLYGERSELREPLAPDVCLESIWVERKLSSSRDSGMPGQASKVFFTRDAFRQQFLCFLVPNYTQLRCIKLDKTNDRKQFIFGSITPIACKDATSLDNSQLMVILDPSGSLVVYTGITKMSKVHIPSCGSPLTRGLRLSFPFGPKVSSRRNSLVAAGCPSGSLEPHFGEDPWTLSPVPSGEAAVLPKEHLEASFFGNLHSVPSPSIVSICATVDNRLSIDLSNGTINQLSIPTWKSSEIVDKALGALQYVLPSDVMLQVLVKWHNTIHAPGSEMTTPLHYWTSCSSVLLGMMGYHIDHTCLGPYLGVDSNSDFLKAGAKKFKLSDAGSNEDWDYLVNSRYHQIHRRKNVGRPDTTAVLVDPTTATVFNVEAPLVAHIPAILTALHLLYEDLKLDKLHWNFLPYFARVLFLIARDLDLLAYVDFYWRDFAELAHHHFSHAKFDADTRDKMNFPPFFVTEPPQIFVWLEQLSNRCTPTPFPYIPHVCQTLRAVALLHAILHGRLDDHCDWETYVRPLVPTGARLAALAEEEPLPWKRFEMPSSVPWEAIVLAMVNMDIKSCDLDRLPIGVALPIRDALDRCGKNPPSDWPFEAYSLVGRIDLAAQLNARQVNPPCPFSVAEHKVPYVSESKKPVLIRDDDDGMEHMDQELLRTLFHRDLRVQEVRRLLQSSKPARIDVPQRPEISDHEYVEEQERHLYSVCIRTMALAVGRGMFTLSTSRPVVTEMLPIPKLCLTGRAPPRTTLLDLTHIDVPANMNLWALFHNGVAAGLCIGPDASDIDATWIVYNKPKANADVPIEHAGFLMALGLNGHLKHLDTVDIYDYAVKGHEMTNLGLLLGISAAKRGTMDLAVTKFLSIHIEALLPATSTELDIPHVVQVASVLGIGLVYQGTAHRHMAEVLMAEIGRPPGPEMENSTDRESYSLAAGLALGLVTLGKGSNVVGLSDLRMADQLYHYMVGGPVRPLSGPAREKYKSASYQIKEGDTINVDVTSPGATMALGFMFFGTGDRTVAKWLTAPDTQYLLDFVRPDFLLLRTLSKGLIMWDEITPSPTWVESHVPDIISSASVLREQHNSYVDIETLSQAYCNIIAGACMVLGLRFAGSANEDAYNTLLKYARTFVGLLGKSASEQAGRSTVENCVNVVVLSLAVVMSGTGDLEVLRLCRHLHGRVGQAHPHVLYGSHMATHMAIGLLFLGGGRYALTSSPSAVAAMICAFFPKFPTHSNDNRYHLQALRHLYVLAAEPRLIIPRDIDTGHICYTHFSVKFKESKWYGESSMVLKAPVLLPQLDLLSEVTVSDARYWPVTFSVGKNWDTLRSLLTNDGTVFVKKRTGCLSHAEDPHGFRSLLAQSLVKDKSGKWTAKPTAIKALTSDPTIRAILDYFLQKCPGFISREAAGNNLITHLIYECVTQEKLEVLGSLISLMQIGSQRSVSSLDLWQVRLIDGLVANRQHDSDDHRPMINEETFVALCSRLDDYCREWIAESPNALISYWNGSSLSSVDERLVPFLVRHKVPPRHELSSVALGSVSESLPLFGSHLERLRIPHPALIQVHRCLTTSTVGSVHLSAS